jgi:hypothetical protein
MNLDAAPINANMVQRVYIRTLQDELDAQEAMVEALGRLVGLQQVAAVLDGHPLPIALDEGPVSTTAVREHCAQLEQWITTARRNIANRSQEPDNGQEPAVSLLDS